MLDRALQILQKCEDTIKHETLETNKARQVYARNLLQINAALYRATRSCKNFLGLGRWQGHRGDVSKAEHLVWIVGHS